MRFQKVIIFSKNSFSDIKTAVENIIEKLDMEVTKKINEAQLAIIIGGDGTFLRYQSKVDLPLLGINPGSSTGYYLSICKKDIKEKLKKLAGEINKDYFIHDLLRLEIYINDEKVGPLALNEVLISPIYTRRMLNTEFKVGEDVSIERNSAIIVYTPTGSNAFAKSAGATPLNHNDKRFGIMALAPYYGKLKNGEILGEKEVMVVILNKEAELCIDGQEEYVFSLSYGDIIKVRKSDLGLKVMGFEENFKN